MGGNISYDLALKLKNAGFPQEGREWRCEHGAHYWNIAEASLCSCEWIYTPTLSELIEACGKDFYSLRRSVSGRWEASGMSFGYANYDTPSEAVANLWFALQDNKVV